MNFDKNPDSSDAEGSEPDSNRYIPNEEPVPLVVREAERLRAALRPVYWMTIVSMILLTAALVVLAYRLGAESCVKP